MSDHMTDDHEWYYQDHHHEYLSTSDYRLKLAGFARTKLIEAGIHPNMGYHVQRYGVEVRGEKEDVTGMPHIYVLGILKLERHPFLGTTIKPFVQGMYLSADLTKQQAYNPPTDEAVPDWAEYFAAWHVT